MLKKLIPCLAVHTVLFSFALPTFANTVKYKDEMGTKPLVTERAYLGGYLGYGNVEGADNNNGQVSIGRLALGYHAMDFKQISFGIEGGWQTGNDMILSESASLFDATAFMPVQATLKPMLDFLITTRTYIAQDIPLSLILKAGVAYRQLQLVDRTSSRDNLRRVNAEVQAGLGYALTQHTMLTAFYQGIYSGSNANLGLDSNGNITIDRIPTQQAGFLGLELSV